MTKRGLGRRHSAAYKKVYRSEFVRAHGGGKIGLEALRQERRLEQRSTRKVRYLPLLFETRDRRYRLWTWMGPSKLIVRSLKEAERMGALFFPERRIVVVAYSDQLDRHLQSALRLAAAGVLIQGLLPNEQAAYAFLLWNECRRYHYLTALALGEVPHAVDANFRLVSYLLPHAVGEPLRFVQFATHRLLPIGDELLQEIETSGFPLDRHDPVDGLIEEFNATLAAAHGWLVASGVDAIPRASSADYRIWFRRRLQLAERLRPGIKEEVTLLPPSSIDEIAAVPDVGDVPKAPHIAPVSSPRGKTPKSSTRRQTSRRQSTRPRKEARQ